MQKVKTYKTHVIAQQKGDPRFYLFTKDTWECGSVYRTEGNEDWVCDSLAEAIEWIG